MDRAVSEAGRYGISLAVMVKETPGWANGAQKPSWAPDDPEDYAAFLQAASRRYPSIHDWMIWGEVTRAGNFNPMPPESPVGPQRYAVLLDAAYGALKAVNPANEVIGGMTYTVGLVSPSNYLRWLRLPDGSPPRMDLYGDNPYSTRYPKLSETPYSPIVARHQRRRHAPPRTAGRLRRDTVPRRSYGSRSSRSPTPPAALSTTTSANRPRRAG